MAQCWGHGERVTRKNRITKMASTPVLSLNENFKVLIKKGPMSVETSIKELEEIASRSKVLKNQSTFLSNKLELFESSYL